MSEPSNLTDPMREGLDVLERFENFINAPDNMVMSTSEVLQCSVFNDVIGALRLDVTRGKIVSSDLLQWTTREDGCQDLIEQYQLLAGDTIDGVDASELIANEIKTLVANFSELELSSVDLVVLSLSRWRSASRASSTQSSQSYPRLIIGVTESVAKCLLHLLNHYPWIVYLGFSMWRKSLLMMNNTKYANRCPLRQHHMGSTTFRGGTASELGFSGALQVGIELCKMMQRCEENPHRLSSYLQQRRPMLISDVVQNDQLLNLAAFFRLCVDNDQKDCVEWMIREFQLTWDLSTVGDSRDDIPPWPRNYDSDEVVVLSRTLLLRNINHPDPEVRQFAALNLAAGLVTNRRELLSIGVDPLLSQLSVETEPTVMAAFAHFFSNFSNIKPYLPLDFYQKSTARRKIGGRREGECARPDDPNFAKVPSLLDQLVKLLHSEDESVSSEAALALSNISNGEERLTPVATPEVIRRAAALMKSPNDEVLLPALRLIGNFFSGADATAELVLKSDKFEYIPRLLAHPSREVRKEICWLLSNIAAGTKEQMDWLLRSGFLPQCIPALGQEFAVKKEALYIFKNYFDNGNEDHLRYLLNAPPPESDDTTTDNTQSYPGQCPCFAPFVGLLGSSKDKRILTPVLETVKDLLGYLVLTPTVGISPLAFARMLAQDYQLKETLATLVKHKDEEVWVAAGDLHDDWMDVMENPPFRDGEPVIEDQTD